jgi:hypothetical protein
VAINSCNGYNIKPLPKLKISFSDASANALIVGKLAINSL